MNNHVSRDRSSRRVFYYRENTCLNPDFSLKVMNQIKMKLYLYVIYTYIIYECLCRERLSSFEVADILRTMDYHYFTLLIIKLILLLIIFLNCINGIISFVCIFYFYSH